MKIHFKKLEPDDVIELDDIWSLTRLDVKPFPFRYFSNKQHSYCWKAIPTNFVKKRVRDVSVHHADSWCIYRPITSSHAELGYIAEPAAPQERKIELNL